MKQPIKIRSLRPGHNHDACIQRAMVAADKLCDASGARLTDLRKRVLQLVWSSHQPATAYDLLEQLRKQKKNAEPPTVYRALEFLQEHNLVHRIESLNAFIGCNHPLRDHTSQFLICSQCNQVTELQDSVPINRAISAQATKLSFNISDQTIEIKGICGSCQ